MNRRVTALVVATVAVFGLTACTGAPSGSSSAPSASSSTGGSSEEPAEGTQTVAEACAVVEDTIVDAQAGFEDVSAEDPAAAAEAMQSVAAAVGELPDKVSNADVSALLPDFVDAYATLADVLTAVAEGDMTKVGELETLGTDLQSSVAAFQELCTA